MKKLLNLFTLFLITTSLEAQNTTTFPTKPELIFVEGGTFTMGTTIEDNETPHKVTLSSYSIGKYEVTVGQYMAYCAATGTAMPDAPKWGWWNDKHPMVNVNYNDAVAYCNWLGEEYGGDWRLPTEAQWEFAAIGGKKSCGFSYSGSNDLDEVAWYADNAGGKTQSVGRKKANELGIYDMSGNVYEWCKDWYEAYESTAQQNPKGASSGSYRVLRGGGWLNFAKGCRLTDRGGNYPESRGSFDGFRVVLSQ